MEPIVLIAHWLPGGPSPLADYVVIGASSVVAVFCGLMWRFGGRGGEANAAFTLALLFLVQELICLYLRGKLPFPLGYAPGGPLDAMLLLLAIDASRESRRPWMKLWCGALGAGLVLQVWFWLSWLPMAAHRYDVAQWRLGFVYVRLSNVLAILELAALVWPGLGQLGSALLARRRGVLHGAGMLGARGFRAGRVAR